MINGILNKKRGIVFFVNDDLITVRKKFQSAKIHGLFNHRAVEVLDEAKKFTQFDLILCSNKANLINSDIFIKQIGRNFSERFNNAIKNSFQYGYDEILIIGNDSPDFSSGMILDSFNKVSQNKIVIGPSYDGGIYLLGLSKKDYANTINVRWNTSLVLSDLLNYYKSREIYLLPELIDIDSESDLAEWFTNNSITARIFKLLLFKKNNTAKKRITQFDFVNSEQTLYRLHTQKAPPL